jgi:hypothetical protein
VVEYLECACRAVYLPLDCLVLTSVCTGTVGNKANILPLPRRKQCVHLLPSVLFWADCYGVVRRPAGNGAIRLAVSLRDLDTIGARVCLIQLMFQESIDTTPGGQGLFEYLQ